MEVGQAAKAPLGRCRRGSKLAGSFQAEGDAACKATEQFGRVGKQEEPLWGPARLVVGDVSSCLSPPTRAARLTGPQPPQTLNPWKPPGRGRWQESVHLTSTR